MVALSANEVSGAAKRLKTKTTDITSVNVLRNGNAAITNTITTNPTLMMSLCRRVESARLVQNGEKNKVTSGGRPASRLICAPLNPICW